MSKIHTIAVRHNGKVVKHPAQVKITPRQEAHKIMIDEKARLKEEKRVVREQIKTKDTQIKKWATKLGMIKKR